MTRLIGVLRRWTSARTAAAVGAGPGAYRRGAIRVYGVGSGSGITSNDIVGATRWPDPSTGAASSGQQDSVTVNALGQTLTSADRISTVLSFGYDVLGRVVYDAVTTLGSGIDGTVRRVGTEYDSQGNAYRITNYDAASGGNVVNQVQRQYNGLGQLTTEWQAVSGAVNTSTPPKVQYAYSEMSRGANHSRQTSMTYPDGFALTSNYSSGLNSNISRLSSLSDSSVTVEGYEYLGLGSLVKRTHPESGADLTYVKLSGESYGDAGDQYTGLDRFGRVADQRWVNSSGTALDREQYGYDRNGNRLYAENGVNAAFSELYQYDNLNQLSNFQRGTLNGAKTSISGTASRSQVWDFDALGNMDSVTSDGVAQTRSANKQNEITSISGATPPTFDASGNMTADESGKTFTYDAWGRVIKVDGTVRYAYDGLNRRIQEGSRALYYTPSWQLIEERESGIVVVRNVWSPAYIDGLILRDRDADSNGSLEERLYGLQDGNWNLQTLIGTDGLVKERFAFDPYGTRTVLTTGWIATTTGYAWVIGHQGGRLDLVTGMHAFRYRDFSSSVMRWNRMDPLNYHSKEKNLNTAYGENPGARVDPTGLRWWPRFVLVGVAGAAGGVIAGVYEVHSVTKELTPAERKWVACNPGCAVASKKIKDDLFRLMVEIFGETYEKLDNNVTNAVKHCTLMCAVASNRDCGKLKAWQLGLSHENYDNNSVHSRDMDIFNNQVGVNLSTPGKSIRSCLEDCVAKARKHELYWFELSPSPLLPPAMGLPTDFPGFSLLEANGNNFFPSNGPLVPPMPSGDSVPGWGLGSDKPPIYK
jgi:RHS repeat-associated protein